MSAQLTITIPVWLDFIFTFPLLTYRRLRYGYTYRRIYLGEGEWTILDQRDYYQLCNFKWSVISSERKDYAARIVRKTEFGRIKTMLLHREIMNAPKGRLVDHRNGDSLDNRRDNLRFATSAENLRNRGKTKRKTSSRFIGVYFHKQRNRWCAMVEHKGKVHWLGRFKSEIEAAKARDKVAKKYHGEFARLNFPESAFSGQRSSVALWAMEDRSADSLEAQSSKLKVQNHSVKPKSFIPPEAGKVLSFSLFQ
jgi:hypothetical protein